ncbi:methylmalonyl-CoA epimerase [Lolliginicoccus suaedae]|uniref:methylmalonyl-CoA epimerase n=1 Tax=Lolliginicoccus suaedae TaxID=2605429 RepID=UPI0011EC55FE|nr:methylmalonyl-CoA epimerase [Lolliginicoccus suaedae]
MLSTPEIGSLITAIDHVGVAVADLDQAIDWYSRTFGLVLAHRETNEGQGVEEAMLVPAAQGTDISAATAIQLLAPLDDSSTIKKFLDRHGPGMQQLAYRVTDLDAVTEHLTGLGVRLLYDEPRRGTADSRINFVHPKDAGGILVELVEPAHGAPHHQ